eukprot:TRINITY_DN1200_c0_g1_i2.p1 TRINITY_DN1200_c0_g1~~TRINITY_DN1200_c0_g1_i2.p1  ORF type:complete len:417 (-),score=107.89 TRINITY_DN1200_c0_g1_i2:51-1301(-)
MCFVLKQESHSSTLTEHDRKLFDINDVVFLFLNRDARVEVARAVETFSIASEETGKLSGEYGPLDFSARNKGISHIVSRVPIGPIAMFSPFNFPLNLSAHKVAPAIAVGCPFILKPSERTPVTALMLGELLAQTSLPKESWSVLPCEPKVANLLVRDDRINCLSFTGSPKIGWMLKSQAGKKRVLLELGGMAPVLIDKDADVDYAVSRLVFGAFYYQGQSCISVQKVYVHESVYDTVRSKLAAAATALTQGDPALDSTFLGPMISHQEAERIDKWVQDAKKLGAKIVTGGVRKEAMLNATILEDMPNGSTLATNEVFGPVCYLQRFSDYKKAIAEMDATPFGLQAGVFTKDINKAFYAYKNLHFGGVVINDVPSIRTEAMPYGGVKESGAGREGVRYAMEDFTEMRVLLLKDIGQL